MIKCSECGGESSVKGSRPVQNTVRRRRKCLSCGLSWTTFEIDRESILKLREAGRLFTALDQERKCMAELAALVSSFEDMEELAAAGRGRTKYKRQLRSRKPKQSVPSIVSEIVDLP